MTTKFQPPAYIPTEQEHKIAYLKYCIEDFSDNVLMTLNPYFQAFNNTVNAAKKDLDIRIKRYIENHTPIWKSHTSYEDFKKIHLARLSEEHSGDCVLAPAPCGRCWAEDLYETPSTATWCSSCEFQNSKYCECKK